MKNLKLLSRIALAFKSSKDFEKDMKEVLEDLAKFINVSRIYIVFNESKDIMKNTFEWCNQGVTPQIQNLQNVRYDDVPSWLELFIKDGYICADDIMKLPKDIIDILSPQDIKSIVVYPLIVENEIRGFIGFDECRYKRQWEKGELEILNTVSGIISNAYERDLFQKDIVEAENNFHNFFDTIDDMFIISNLEGKIVHCNKSLSHKLGYSLLELKEMNLLELHPMDKREEAAMIIEKMINSETQYCPLEVESKLGEIFLVETRIWFGRWDKKDCIYSISKDITKEDKNSKEKERLRKKLNEELDKLNNIIEGTSLGTWEWNIQTGEFRVNDIWAEMIGYSLDEVGIRDIEIWNKIAHAEDLKESKERMEKHLQGKLEKYESEIRMKHKDGSWLWFQDRGKITERDKDGQALKMFGTHSNISKEKEQALELERFFSLNLDLLCIADTEGNFIKTNKAWENILGYSREKLEGHKFLDFVHKDDIASTLEAINQLKANEEVINFTNRYVGADGEYHYIEWRSSPYGNVIYAAARDITKRIEYEKKILEISNKDALTGVYNRRYIYSRAEEIIEEYKRTEQIFSICIIDIDRFKNINDKYGHQAGDYILKEFTKFISKNIRAYDLLGRYGGEEFIIILKNVDGKESYLIVKRILEGIRDKVFTYNGDYISFTFSGGISSCSEIEKEKIAIYELIEIADKRMYDAKKTGRNKIIFE